MCGAAVYFYSNEHGSRVYFDEMGPPWPKHPCTQQGASPSARVGHARVEPVLYPIGEGQERLALAVRTDRRSGDASYGQTNGDAWIVVDQWVEDDATFLILRRAYSLRGPRVWQALDPVDVSTGSLVFIASDQLSYVDMTTLEAVTAEVLPYRYHPRTSLLGRLRAAWSR
ncbi:hypothetical protein J1G44_06130 [Cellulomonas sp. zg-ZUI199]|uniref:Glutamine amidotransferase type-2 domain-containing protein n=1 Tax=Cellulomonas wangleii TaxID=2816956 RepID=A0ABX8D8J8_9CELL|nr:MULTISPECIES: hypothetical protein [Cellulomonas]MBO0898939.1 hypothetical protein [Cellulomonas sp. zg-ZUI22]MBO0923774.1 hypothetical protein [Cellulomonas wangleii]MBO0924056.1 hypothetical protein [Cellulomonas wangleii]QVI62082.1 hypothetical protein KG103_16980 [Cellulomonas wangleii]